MYFSRLGFVRVALVGCAVVMSAAAAAQSPSGSEMFHLGLRGVYFVPNEGQWSDDDVIYGFKSRGMDVAFRESGLTMHLARETGGALGTDETRGVEDSAPAWDRLTLGVSFPGSNEAMPVGAKPQAAKFNYFVGGEGRRNASGVPSFGEVVYPNLYDGVDLHVMGSDDGVLKYEFHVAPGADWSRIRIAYDGVDSLCVDSSGDLQISTMRGTLTDGAPVVWQGDAARVDIPAHFELCDGPTYRIALDGAVDPTRELVIDPDVEWMVYLGGGSYETGVDVELDQAGNVFITGPTNSAHFNGATNGPLGNEDAFVLKTNSIGEVQWMTYICGSGDDYAMGLTLNSAGHALVTGYTNSTDVPHRTNELHGGIDAYVLEVDDDGQLVWMTYLGGSGDEWGTPYGGRFDAVVDQDENVLVVGKTASTDFEGKINSFHGGTWDAFVLKLQPAGQVVWMKYLGGSGDDQGSGIGVDNLGNVLVGGLSNSLDFEGHSNQNHGVGPHDAFALKMDRDGQVLWMDYLGGSGSEEAYALAVTSTGGAVLAGRTDSRDFFGRTNSMHGSDDGFVCKVSADGEPQWMTYVGGSDVDWTRGITVDSADAALAVGSTRSTDFEGSSNENHGDSNNYDAFILKVDPAGRLDWMTYLGGSDFQGYGDSGFGICLNQAGDALVTGSTGSDDFEGRINSHYNFTDVFLLRFRVGDNPRLSVKGACPNGGPIQIAWDGATGGGVIALLFARNRGSFVLPNGTPCMGTELGLGANQLRIAYRGSAGAEGSRTLNASVGFAACGGYLQLLDLSNCATSNVARIE